MKNNNSELLNKIIEPNINYVSLKNDFDIDFDDIDNHDVIFLTDDN